MRQSSHIPAEKSCRSTRLSSPSGWRDILAGAFLRLTSCSALRSPAESHSPSSVARGGTSLSWSRAEQKRPAARTIALHPSKFPIPPAFCNAES